MSGSAAIPANDLRLRRAVDALDRHTTWLVIGFAVLLGTIEAFNGGYTWHYVVTGTRTLFSSEAGHLYSLHPEVQMGPLTFMVAAPFVFLPHRIGLWLAMAAFQALGLAVFALLHKMAKCRHDVSSGGALLAGLLFVAAWTELAVRWCHPDDGCAIALVVLALWLLDKPLNGARVAIFAVCLGAAVDFKPWAAAFLPLVLALPRRRWVPAAMTSVLTIVIAWMPFMIADRNTSRILHFRVPNVADSSLRIFGVTDAMTPNWLRSVQLGTAALSAILVVTRARAWSILAAVVAVRMLLDPATKSYYDAGLVVGTLLVDGAVALGRVPRLTVCVVALLLVPNYLLVAHPVLRGALRAAGLIVVIVTVLVSALRPSFTFRRPARPDARHPRSPAAAGGRG